MPKPVTTSYRTLIAGAGVLFVVLVAAAITIVWLAHRARSAEARWRDQAAKTRLAQSQADFVHACFEAESGRRSNAVALLARSVRNDPNHLPSRMRLFFLLVQNSWPVPAIEPPPGHSPPNKTPDISQLIASLPAGSELVRALPDPEAEPSSLPKTSPVFLRPDGDEIIVLVNSWDGSSQGKHGRLVSFSTETGEAVSTIARFSNPVQDGAVGSGSLCAVLTGGNPREVAELHLLDLATGEMKMAFPVPSPRVTEGSDAFVGDITFTPSEQAVRVVWSDFSNPNLTSALYIDVASGHVLSTNGHAPVAPPRDHKFKLPLAGAFVTGATSVDNRWEVVVRVNSDPKGFASFVAQLWDAETGRNYYSDAVDDPEAGALPRISNLGGAGDESVVNDVDGRCVGVVVDPSRGPIANILSSFVIASDSSAVWAVDCGDERPKSYYTGQFDKRIDEIGTIGKVVFLRTSDSVTHFPFADIESLRQGFVNVSSDADTIQTLARVADDVYRSQPKTANQNHVPGLPETPTEHNGLRSVETELGVSLQWLRDQANVDEVRLNSGQMWRVTVAEDESKAALIASGSHEIHVVDLDDGSPIAKIQATEKPLSFRQNVGGVWITGPSSSILVVEYGSKGGGKIDLYDIVTKKKSTTVRSSQTGMRPTVVSVSASTAPTSEQFSMMGRSGS